MKTVVVVEGKSDSRRLKEIYPNILTFETSGLGLDNSKIKTLKKYQYSGYKLICMTDPDHAGEVIREVINREIPGVYNAYVSKKASIGKDNKIGVETCSEVEIRKALDNLYVSNLDQKKLYDLDFLIKHGIYGNKEIRSKLCEKLNLADGNNKKLLNQLNQFQIDIDKIKEAINE